MLSVLQHQVMIKWLHLDITDTIKEDTMKRQIRRSTFESNSSSTHVLTMVMESEYDKLAAGELVYDYYNDKLIPVTEEVHADGDLYFTIDQFYDWEFNEYETFTDEITTPGGEKVICFGYYGYDN